MAGRLIKWGIKFGLVGGAVYATNEAGFWKDSATSEQLYKEIVVLTKPLVKDIEVPIELPQIPRSDDVIQSMRNGWNHGVVATAQFIADSPQHLCSLWTQAKTFAVDLMNAPEEK